MVSISSYLFFFLFLFFSYKTMKFDDILVHLGQFGYYQKRLYLLLCLPAVSTGCYMMMLFFVMHAPDKGKVGVE